jgi:hypothetical protein
MAARQGREHHVTIDPTSMPPRWADTMLRLLLKPADRDAVSGDLLEEYRDSVRPTRGRRRADAWFVGQVARVLWNATWLWALLLTAAVVGRDALDWWLAPTEDYYARSVVSTWTAVSLFALSGGWIAWRSRSIRASIAAGVATGATAAVVTIAASAAELTMHHDPHTMRMIAASGGLGELFLLPLIAIVPATVISTVAGIVAKSLASMRRAP